MREPVPGWHSCELACVAGPVDSLELLAPGVFVGV